MEQGEPLRASIKPPSSTLLPTCLTPGTHVTPLGAVHQNAVVARHRLGDVFMAFPNPCSGFVSSNDGV